MDKNINIDINNMIIMVNSYISGLKDIIKEDRARTFNIKNKNIVIINIVCDQVDLIIDRINRLKDHYDLEDPVDLQDLDDIIYDLQYHMDRYLDFTMAYMAENDVLQSALKNQVDVIKNISDILTLIKISLPVTDPFTKIQT